MGILATNIVNYSMKGPDPEKSPLAAPEDFMFSLTEEEREEIKGTRLEDDIHKMFGGMM